jgi:hypothetical protein
VCGASREPYGGREMKTTQRNAVTVTGDPNGRPMMFSHRFGCVQKVQRQAAGSTLVSTSAAGHCPNVGAPEKTVAAIKVYL